MLKFLRKYQKWMLVVFCGVLMVAFLVPQAATQFGPNPAKDKMGSTYDGEKIIREDVNQTVRDLGMMRRLNLDPIPLNGLVLIPSSGDELMDAIHWTLILRAAEHNNLGASKQEAFDLMAAALDVTNEEDLEKKAQEVLEVNLEYLYKIGKQYLIAEQYRQLVSGVAYSVPTGKNKSVGTPGLQRYFAAREARPQVGQLLSNQQMLAQFAQIMGITPNELIERELRAQGVWTSIVGDPRLTNDQLRYAMQRELTELDLTVVLVDAEDRLEATLVDDAFVKEIFDRFADDDPGTGQPYGLGYRVQPRVKLEALRIPIEQLREKVAAEINPDDVRQFFNDNSNSYLDLSALEAGQVPSANPTPTAAQRDEIRKVLILQRSQELAVEIAERARVWLNEDSLRLPREGAYVVLPDDFEPTPLTEIVADIERDYEITAEIIQVEDWMSSRSMIEKGAFTQSWLTRVPHSTVKVPNAQLGGFLMPEMVFDTPLAGKAGLFATVTSETIAGTRQPIPLAQYIAFAQPFVEPDSLEAQLKLQVGLPGEVLSDLTGSAYTFRLTDADPSHPATDMAPIAEQVREDALKVKAYQNIIAEKEALKQRAIDQSVENLMAGEDAKRTLSGLTRQVLSSRQTTPIEGVDDTRPILTQAFGIADELIASGGLDAADPAKRHFVIEVPGNYKLAVVRLDAIRPLSQTAFQQSTQDPFLLATATRVTLPDDTPQPMSFEALSAATGFKWDDGFGPDNLEEDGAEDEEDEDE